MEWRGTRWNRKREKNTVEPTGSESPVRAALRARYLLLTGMVCDQWQLAEVALQARAGNGGRPDGMEGTSWYGG